MVPACAALWVGGTKGDVTSCVFEGNSAALSGGALHLSDGAHVSAAANQYRSNQAKAVGGWATGKRGGGALSAIHAPSVQINTATSVCCYLETWHLWVCKGLSGRWCCPVTGRGRGALG